jgi:hypothetical protein
MYVKETKHGRRWMLWDFANSLGIQVYGKQDHLRLLVPAFLETPEVGRYAYLALDFEPLIERPESGSREKCLSKIGIK